MLQVILPARRFIERQRGPDHRGEVGRQPWKFELALPPGMAEPIAARHRTRDEGEGALGDRQPRRLGEDLAGIGKRRDHQAVPVGQHLIVKAGPHARCAGGKQLRTQYRKPLLILLAARKRRETIENIVAFEIAASGVTS